MHILTNTSEAAEKLADQAMQVDRTMEDASFEACVALTGPYLINGNDDPCYFLAIASKEEGLAKAYQGARDSLMSEGIRLREDDDVWLGACRIWLKAQSESCSIPQGLEFREDQEMILLRGIHDWMAVIPPSLSNGLTVQGNNWYVSYSHGTEPIKARA